MVAKRTVGTAVVNNVGVRFASIASGDEGLSRRSIAMSIFRSNLVAVTAALGALLMVGSAHATKYKAPTSEVLLLPRFCWGQYLEGVDGPGYEIRDCGVFMNHYCDGLLELNRARKPTAKRGEKIQHLTHAKQNTLYTLNGMKDFPACSIRRHSEETLQQINALLRLYTKQ
jgi:hypothetical protein